MKILEYSRSGEAIDSLKVPVTVNGREQSVVSFPVDVPRDIDSLTFKVIFASKSFSDAVQFGVPVHDASQVITESHSAIVLPGADKDKLLESLRSRFVNVSSAGAVCDEISIGRMIEEAATQKSEPSANDVLSLTDEHISVVRQAAEPAREAQELSGIQILDRRCQIRNIPAKTSHQSHPIKHRCGDRL